MLSLMEIKQSLSIWKGKKAIYKKNSLKEFSLREFFSFKIGWDGGDRTPDAGFRVRSLTTWRHPKK